MRWLRANRGDTLVEVIFALVILSSILVTTLSIGRVSRVSGENSQLRTQTINLVQEQYEALKSYRDSTSWANFVGRCVGPCNDYGVNIADSVSPGCSGAAPPGPNCIIHMERDSRPGTTYGNWVPCPGSWNPPLDYDSTWSTVVTPPSPGEQADSYYRDNSGKGCRGNYRTNAGQTEAQTNITVKIQLLSKVNGTCPQPNVFAFQIIGSWQQGGAFSNDSTSLNTIIANVKGDPPGC